MQDRDDDEVIIISKSEQKRQVEALKELGKQLLLLNREQLNKLALDPVLHEALQEHHRLTSHEAKRRQLQRISKLIRHTDHEKLASSIAIFDAASREHAQHFQQLEQWRERLLQDDQALTELVNTYPQVEQQLLRQLIRNARREETQGKPPASARKLFRYLRELLENS